MMIGRLTWGIQQSMVGKLWDRYLLRQWQTILVGCWAQGVCLLTHTCQGILYNPWRSMTKDSLGKPNMGCLLRTSMLYWHWPTVCVCEFVSFLEKLAAWQRTHNCKWLFYCCVAILVPQKYWALVKAAKAERSSGNEAGELQGNRSWKLSRIGSMKVFPWTLAFGRWWWTMITGGS